MRTGGGGGSQLDPPPRGRNPFSAKSHSLGFKPRPARIREAEILYREWLRRRHPEIDDEELERRVESYLKVLRESGTAALREFERTEPSSVAPRRSSIDPLVEVLAMRRLDEIRSVERHLEEPPSRGRPADLSLAVSVFESMAWERGRPEVLAARRALTGPDPLRALAYCYPAGPDARSPCYYQLHRILERADWTVALEANVKLIRRLAALRDADGSPRHLNVGRWMAVDGTPAEADVPQLKPVNEEHAAFLRRTRKKVDYSIKAGPSGEPSERWYGNRLIAVVDVATSLPVVWRLVEATAYEPHHALGLIGDLFALWPGCSLHALIGDGLYTPDREFTRQLLFDWYVQPLFPPKGAWAKRLPYAETLGVPHCRHGAMRMEKRDEFYDAAKAARAGIRRGQPVPNPTAARIRWVCPARECRRVYTRSWVDPTLYTYYPFGGDHRLYYERVAVQARRNCVESVFASVKDQGFAGRGPERAAWANDDGEMEWLAAMSLLGLTARRVVHETGLYSETYDVVESLGLLSRASVQDPAPGPRNDQVRFALRRLGLEARGPGASYQRRSAA